MVARSAMFHQVNGVRKNINVRKRVSPTVFHLAVGHAAQRCPSLILLVPFHDARDPFPSAPFAHSRFRCWHRTSVLSPLKPCRFYLTHLCASHQQSEKTVGLTPFRPPGVTVFPPKSCSAANLESYLAGSSDPLSAAISGSVRQCHSQLSFRQLGVEPAFQNEDVKRNSGRKAD